MPVIPAFNEYAPAPNLAQAYLGQQKLQQEAAADAARISLGYATLRQRAVENEMQLAAQKEATSRAAIRQAQEDEIQKAYRENQLGLAERQLKSQEAVNQMKLAESAGQFAAQQAYMRIRASKMAGGMPELQASQEAMREAGFGFQGFPGVIDSTPQLGTRETSSDRALRFKILQGKKEEAAIRHGIRTPEYRKAIEEIDREIESLFPKPQAALNVPPGVATASVSPTNAPPQNWSMYMGAVPPTQFQLTPPPPSPVTVVRKSKLPPP